MSIGAMAGVTGLGAIAFLSFAGAYSALTDNITVLHEHCRVLKYLPNAVARTIAIVCLLALGIACVGALYYAICFMAANDFEFSKQRRDKYNSLKTELEQLSDQHPDFARMLELEKQLERY